MLRCLDFSFPPITRVVDLNKESFSNGCTESNSNNCFFLEVPLEVFLVGSKDDCEMAGFSILFCFYKTVTYALLTYMYSMLGL